jgi:ribosomal-protein-alanine N-acetyltransferase
VKLDTPIVSARLVIRELVPGDVPAIAALARQPDICANWGWDRSPDIEAAEFVAAAVASQDDPARARFDLAITLGATGQLIGDCEVGVMPGGAEAEIGFCIDAAHRRKGLATEAVRALVAFGFDTLKLGKIYGLCAQGNEPSHGTMARAGLMIETAGQFRNEQTGLMINAWLMSATPGTWSR